MGTSTVTAGQATTSLILNRMPLTPDQVIQFAGGNDNNPWFRLWTMLPSESTANSKARWFEAEDYAATVTVSTAASDSATTLIIPNYKILVASQMLYNKRTGERLRVSATPSSSSVSVTRSVGTTAAAAVLAGDVLIKMSTAMKEGSSPADTYTSEPWIEYNVVQTMRHGWSVTGLAAKEQLWGMDKESYDRELAARAFMSEIEQTILFGDYSYEAISSDMVRTTGGIEYFMLKDGSRSLNYDVSGEIFNEALFNHILTQYFARASTGGNKMLMCGTNLFLAMSSWVREKQMYVNEGMTKALGTTVSSYLCSTGQKITIMPYTPWMHDGERGTSVKDRAWIVDLDRISKVSVPGRPGGIELMTTGTSDGNLVSVGVDAVKHELWCEWGLKLKNTENFANITGIQA